MSGEVGHLVLQESGLLQNVPGGFVHGGSDIIRGHAEFSLLYLLVQVSSSLQSQLVQRHVIIAHTQNLLQLAFPRCHTLTWNSEHHVDRHASGAEGPSLRQRLQSLLRVMVPPENPQTGLVQRLGRNTVQTRRTYMRT